MLLSCHRRILSVPLVSLPSCAWPMTRLLIGKPYTWNGRHRAHQGLQRTNTIEKRQQKQTHRCLRANVIWKRRRQRAQLRLHRIKLGREKAAVRRATRDRPETSRSRRGGGGVKNTDIRKAPTRPGRDHVLLKGGKDLIASGDISAARLMLKRAADANDAEAALALAATYDPFVLRELRSMAFRRTLRWRAPGTKRQRSLAQQQRLDALRY